jgi:hypothetical protein
MPPFRGSGIRPRPLARRAARVASSLAVLLGLGLGALWAMHPPTASEGEGTQIRAPACLALAPSARLDDHRLGAEARPLRPVGFEQEVAAPERRSDPRRTVITPRSPSLSRWTISHATTTSFS